MDRTKQDWYWVSTGYLVRCRRFLEVFGAFPLSSFVWLPNKTLRSSVSRLIDGSTKPPRSFDQRRRIRRRLYSSYAVGVAPSIGDALLYNDWLSLSQDTQNLHHHLKLSEHSRSQVLILNSCLQVHWLSRNSSVSDNKSSTLRRQYRISGPAG
ncbi:hypothetical protein FPV67DRAFT_264426 [Lyophyllum atratum]|nr:hypothetical protein FPV67DRAFT_264426 [Lyophyllum atratum]